MTKKYIPYSYCFHTRIINGHKIKFYYVSTGKEKPMYWLIWN